MGITTKSYLPEPNTPEAEQLKRQYPSAGQDQLEQWARHYGYKNKKQFADAMRNRLGAYRSQSHMEERGNEQIIVNLPPIKLREYKAPKQKRGDEEIAILHTGDGHAGKITKSFNEDVYRENMDTLFDSVMTIVTLHRHMYPIKCLRIINCGDNIQGENPHQGSIVGAVKMGARDQRVKLALPAWLRLICSLKQEFEEVIFDGFPGNHGHDILAPETSREDLSLYDLLQAKLSDQRGITINIHEQFGDILNIGGWRFFVAHLDGIPCQQGIPYFAIDRALKAWFMQFGGFSYAVGGHFHKKHLGDEISAVLRDFFICSTLVSDDDWALKKLKISSNPSQNIMGVHSRMGVTWRYPVIVNKKFLPEKDKEG